MKASSLLCKFLPYRVEYLHIEKTFCLLQFLVRNIDLETYWLPYFSCSIVASNNLLTTLFAHICRNMFWFLGHQLNLRSHLLWNRGDSAPTSTLQRRVLWWLQATNSVCKQSAVINLCWTLQTGHSWLSLSLACSAKLWEKLLDFEDLDFEDLDDDVE